VPAGAGGVGERGRQRLDGSLADRLLAAGQLFELENRLPQADAAYRSAWTSDESLLIAAARLAVVLMKQRRDADAIGRT
jgi:hypothetical protein